jgi:hypothetical protein
MDGGESWRVCDGATLLIKEDLSVQCQFIGDDHLMLICVVETDDEAVRVKESWVVRQHMAAKRQREKKNAAQEVDALSEQVRHMDDGAEDLEVLMLGVQGRHRKVIDESAGATSLDISFTKTKKTTTAILVAGQVCTASFLRGRVMWLHAAADKKVSAAGEGVENELEDVSATLILKQDNGPIHVGTRLEAAIESIEGAGAGNRAWIRKLDAWVEVESGSIATLGRFTGPEASLTVLAAWRGGRRLCAGARASNKSVASDVTSGVQGVSVGVQGVSVEFNTPTTAPRTTSPPATPRDLMRLAGGHATEPHVDQGVVKSIDGTV